MITKLRKLTSIGCGLLIFHLTLATSSSLAGEAGDLEAYANRSNSLVFEIADKKNWSGGLVRWQLFYETRILKQGTVNVYPDGETFTLEITFPPLKNDHIIETQLRLEVLQNGDDQAVVTDKTVHVFGDDPFTAIRNHSGPIDTVLFDPRSASTEFFERINIPIERLNSLNDVQTDQHRLLIVGEDVSLRQQEVQQLLEFARRGMTVLMTNPKQLEIPLDATTYLADKPSSMRFFNQVSLAAKPLGAYAISHRQALVKASLHLTEIRSGASVEVRNDNFGWRWFELNFESRGKFLVGSYSLVQETKKSPSLLYFLKELIEAAKIQA